MAMTITSLRVIATSGANKRPTYGEATFSDGHQYRWSTLQTSAPIFFGHRKRHGVWEGFSFASKPRAAALNAKLEG